MESPLSNVTAKGRPFEYVVVPLLPFTEISVKAMSRE